MKDKGLCVAVGKCVGSSYRKLAESTAEVTTSCRDCCANAVNSVVEETKAICTRIGNLFKTVDYDSRLAHWQMKQKDSFTKLGGKIFRFRGPELDGIFQEESIKEVLEEVRENETYIQKIKSKVSAQRKRMQKMTVFKHAIGQLKKPEPRVRRAALRVLQKVGKKEAIPEIVKLLEDPDEDVRNDAKRAIQKLSESGGKNPAGKNENSP